MSWQASKQDMAFELEREKENGLVSDTCGDCIHFNGRYWCHKGRYTEGKDDPITTCPDFERKNMSNIKLTAEVNGKKVPLENISTETFEAIKALEKPKEIPVARVGDYKAYAGAQVSRRLFLKVTDSIRRYIVGEGATLLVIDLEDGCVVNSYRHNNELSPNMYENVQPL